MCKDLVGTGLEVRRRCQKKPANNQTAEKSVVLKFIRGKAHFQPGSLVFRHPTGQSGAEDFRPSGFRRVWRKAAQLDPSFFRR